MKIKDIILDSCNLLGLDDEVAILQDLDEEGEATALENENIKKLLNLVRFSIQELCTNYVPVVATAEVTTTDKTYAVKDLTNFIRIQNIFKDKAPVRFKQINRVLNFQIDGEYTIEYLTYPDIESLFDEVDFLSNFSPDAIVFGLCSYYCLSKGMFDDFDSFHEKYIDKAESLKDLKIFELPKKRWV